MTVAINQMQMRYEAEEDRILFRMNTTASQEFRFWVTRRYAILLLRVLREHMESDLDVSSQGTPLAKDAVRDFKQQQALDAANFAEGFREDANEMPLGKEALLAYRLTYNIKDDILHLGIQPKEGQGINMTINRELNSSLSQLLLTAARKGEWQIDTIGGISVSPGRDNIVIN